MLVSHIDSFGHFISWSPYAIQSMVATVAKRNSSILALVCPAALVIRCNGSWVSKNPDYSSWSAGLNFKAYAVLDDRYLPSIQAPIVAPILSYFWGLHGTQYLISDQI